MYTVSPKHFETIKKARHKTRFGLMAGSLYRVGCGDQNNNFRLNCVCRALPTIEVI